MIKNDLFDIFTVRGTCRMLSEVTLTKLSLYLTHTSHCNSTQKKFLLPTLPGLSPIDFDCLQSILHWQSQRTEGEVVDKHVEFLCCFRIVACL